MSIASLGGRGCAYRAALPGTPTHSSSRPVKTSPVRATSPAVCGRGRTGEHGMVWLEMINIRTAGIVEAGKVSETCRRVFESVAVGNLLKMMGVGNGLA